MDYRFTANWFEATAKANWDQLIPRVDPSRILEIGSYEGASTCYLIEHVAARKPLELCCIDTWHGGIEHQEAAIDMAAIEAHFDHNTRLACAAAPNPVTLDKRKDRSDHALAALLAAGKAGYFDFVYVDGSHQAADVLCDALLGFRLLRVGGLLGFDDYLWHEQAPAASDLLRCPKPAIDAFTNVYFHKLDIIRAPLYQLYAQKLAD